MKKFIKNIIVVQIGIILFLLMGIHNVKAANLKGESTNVVVTVNENGLYHIEQQLEINFLGNSNHGIEIRIPNATKLELEDEGKIYKRKYSTPISNISVKDYNFKVKEQDDITTIRIGDADKFVTGKVVYNVSYDIKMKDLGVNNKQMFYYNILGTDWEFQFEKFSFKINFPKDVPNRERFKIYSGKYYSSENEDVVFYWTDSKTVEGYSKKPIDFYSGVTGQMLLPNGYLNLEKNNKFLYVGIVISVITMLFIIYKFIRYGRDRQIIPITSFYPPQNLDSDVLGAIDNLSITNKHVMSQIFMWAKKGYIEISQDDKKNIVLTRTVGTLDYKMKFAAETTLFVKMFPKNGSTFIVKDRSVKGDLILSYKESLFNHVEDNYDLIDSKTKILQNICAGLSIIGISINLFEESSIVAEENVIVYAVVMVVGLFFAITWSRKLMYDKLKTNILVGAYSLVIFAMMYLFVNYYYLDKLLLIQPILFSIQVFFTVHMTNWSESGAKLYGEVQGFKDFLIKAEKDKLEMLLEDNPKYFYDILPYTFSLGISEIWLDKFKNIDLASYSGGYVPSVWDIHQMYYLSKIMSNDTISGKTGGNISTGGDSFSSDGGGFSGGGFGGGGGGGW